MIDGKDKEILVVILDDEADLAEELAEWLDLSQIQTIHTSSVNDFLRIVDQRADITTIIIDVRLPFTNGYDVIKRVERNGGLSGKKVIYMSGSPTSEDFIKMKSVSSFEFISKPIDNAKLYQMIFGR